jgi:hypothetical protein
VIQNLSCRLHNDDIDALLAHYADSETGTADRRRFVRDISNFGSTQARAVLPSALTDGTRRVLRKLKAFLHSRLLEGLTLFKAEKGGATDRVRAVFARIGFRILPYEEDDLFGPFTAQGMPEQIQYRVLLDQMENETITNDDLVSAKIVKSQSNSGEYELVNALITIHGKLFARRRRANDVFLGLSDDPIPVSDFRQRFQNYGLIISVPDLERIARKYRVNLRGDIDWKTFAVDCDTIKTIEGPR